MKGSKVQQLAFSCKQLHCNFNNITRDMNVLQTLSCNIYDFMMWTTTIYQFDRTRIHAVSESHRLVTDFSTRSIQTPLASRWWKTEL